MADNMDALASGSDDQKLMAMLRMQQVMISMMGGNSSSPLLAHQPPTDPGPAALAKDIPAEVKNKKAANHAVNHQLNLLGDLPGDTVLNLSLGDQTGTGIGNNNKSKSKKKKTLNNNTDNNNNSGVPSDPKKQSDGRRFIARMKSYHVEKGFGFAWSPDLEKEFGGDIFLHSTELEKCDSSLAECGLPVNAVVSFEVIRNKNDKPQVRALEIESEADGIHIPRSDITPAAGTGLPGLEKKDKQQQSDNLPLGGTIGPPPGMQGSLLGGPGWKNPMMSMMYPMNPNPMMAMMNFPNATSGMGGPMGMNGMNFKGGPMAPGGPFAPNFMTMGGGPMGGGKMGPFGGPMNPMMNPTLGMNGMNPMGPMGGMASMGPMGMPTNPMMQMMQNPMMSNFGGGPNSNPMMSSLNGPMGNNSNNNSLSSLNNNNNNNNTSNSDNQNNESTSPTSPRPAKTYDASELARENEDLRRKQESAEFNNNNTSSDQQQGDDLDHNQNIDRNGGGPGEKLKSIDSSDNLKVDNASQRGSSKGPPADNHNDSHHYEDDLRGGGGGNSTRNNRKRNNLNGTVDEEVANFTKTLTRGFREHTEKQGGTSVGSFDWEREKNLKNAADFKAFMDPDEEEDNFKSESSLNNFKNQLRGGSSRPRDHQIRDRAYHDRDRVTSDRQYHSNDISKEQQQYQQYSSQSDHYNTGPGSSSSSSVPRGRAPPPPGYERRQQYDNYDRDYDHDKYDDHDTQWKSSEPGERSVKRRRREAPLDPYGEHQQHDHYDTRSINDNTHYQSTTRPTHRHDRDQQYAHHHTAASTRTDSRSRSRGSRGSKKVQDPYNDDPYYSSNDRYGAVGGSNGGKIWQDHYHKDKDYYHRSRGGRDSSLSPDDEEEDDEYTPNDHRQQYQRKKTGGGGGFSDGPSGSAAPKKDKLVAMRGSWAEYVTAEGSYWINLETNQRSTEKPSDFQVKASMANAQKIRQESDPRILYVQNIPVTWRNEDLQQQFMPFGVILSVDVPRNEASNNTISLNRGYGFVSYSTPNDAQTALISMNGFEVLDPSSGQRKAIQVGVRGTHLAKGTTTPALDRLGNDMQPTFLNQTGIMTQEVTVNTNSVVQL